MVDLKTAQIKQIKRANTDWWIHEQSMVGNDGITYIAYCNDIGEIRVKSIDAKCKNSPSRDVCLCRLNCMYADEHNAPSICVMEDGRIIVAYTAHGTNFCMKYRMTERPWDLLSFGPERELQYDAQITYAQISENVGKGELWLFARVASVNWEFRYSKDRGETWSEPKRFLSSDAGGLFYFDVHHQWICVRDQKLRTHGSGVCEQWFFALYGHPRISNDHTVRAGIFDAEGNLLTMDGEKMGINLYEGDVIDLRALSKVYESPEGTTVRLCAVSPLPPYRVGIASFILDVPESITYYSATYRDGAWFLSVPIASGGEFLSPATMRDGSQTYVGGMAYYYGVGEDGLAFEDFAPTETNCIYIARFDGACRVLESYVSRDWGHSYHLEQVIRKIPKEENKKIWRPVVPIYAHDNLPVYWHEGVYGAHTGGWHSDVVMYIDYDL